MFQELDFSNVEIFVLLKSTCQVKTSPANLIMFYKQKPRSPAEVSAQDRDFLFI